MNKKDKFRKIERRYKISSRTGQLMTLLSFSDTVKKNKVLSTVVLVTGGVCSASSFVTYVQSLEQYGLTKKVDEPKIVFDFLKIVVVMPIIDITLMANSIRGIIKNQ